MGSRYLIRRATPDDLQTVLRLIDDAAAWLRGREVDQWARPWPTRAARDHRVRDGLSAGKTWIAWDGGIAAATITLSCDGDPRLWTERELGEPAAYVHRLVIDRRYAGVGLGAELLDWAGLRAWQEWGARYIRIDVWTTNSELQAYYLRQEFTRVRLCPDTTYPAGCLMEKPIHRIARRIQPFGLGPVPEHRLISPARTTVATSGRPRARRQDKRPTPHERPIACAAHRRPWQAAESGGRTEGAGDVDVRASKGLRLLTAMTRRAVPATTIAVAQLALLTFDIGIALVQFASEPTRTASGTDQWTAVRDSAGRARNGDHDERKAGRCGSGLVT